jgi:hypothetical protein
VTLELRGGFAALAPCVWCHEWAGTGFRAEGLPGAPVLPLHIRCGALLIAAARRYMDTGDASGVPEQLREGLRALGAGGER